MEKKISLILDALSPNFRYKHTFFWLDFRPFSFPRFRFYFIQPSIVMHIIHALFFFFSQSGKSSVRPFGQITLFANCTGNSRTWRKTRRCHYFLWFRGRATVLVKKKHKCCVHLPVIEWAKSHISAMYNRKKNRGKKKLRYISGICRLAKNSMLTTDLIIIFEGMQHLSVDFQISKPYFSKST